MSAHPTAKQQHNQAYTVITEPPFAPGWRMATHAHRQHEISILEQGTCSLILDTETHQLCAGDVFFIPGQVPHAFEAYEQVQFTVVQFMTLSPELCDSLMNLNTIGRFQLSNLERSQFSNLCFQLQQEISSNLPYSDLQCATLIDQIIIVLLRAANHSSNLERLSEAQRKMIQQAINLMHANLTTGAIRVKDIAAEVGCSTTHFRRLFKLVTNTSPKQYHLALKLQASKCHLMHAHMSITDVAMRSGYNSPQQFSKAFRQLTGVTPTQWRNTYLCGD